MSRSDPSVSGNPSVDWVLQALRGNPDTVGSVVPESFPAYARILHPILDGAGNHSSWRDVSQATGKRLHPLVRWDEIVGASSSTPGAQSWRGSEPSAGPMEPEEFDKLFEILRSSLCSGDVCCFAYWVGWGCQRVGPGPGRSPHDVESENDSVSDCEAPGSVTGDRIPPVFIGNREYALRCTSVADILDRRTAEVSRREPPDLCWAANRSWFVHSDVELNSTLVGASDDLVKALLATRELEVLRVTPGSVVV
jgi:hypothetical protein